VARRVSGAVIGIVGAVGALGGVLIDLALRESFLMARTGAPAFWTFLASAGGRTRNFDLSPGRSAR